MPMIQITMQRLLLMVGVVFVLGLGVSSAHAQLADTQPNAYRPQKGQFHPDFILPNINDGKPVRLSDLRGKHVLLVHFASW